MLTIPFPLNPVLFEAGVGGSSPNRQFSRLNRDDAHAGTTSRPFALTLYPHGVPVAIEVSAASGNFPAIFPVSQNLSPFPTPAARVAGVKLHSKWRPLRVFRLKLGFKGSQMI